MDKAEERALECYPSLTDPFERSKRLVYRNGYHQAEKDFGWVSVKDRLPEEDGWYFTCVEQFKIPQCVGITYFDKKTDGWYNEIPMTKRILVSTIEIVDYWMPIPELPEEEEK